ncbi:MAG: hypothetical protein ACM3X9_12655 [Bacillota bacterium]
MSKTMLFLMALMLTFSLGADFLTDPDTSTGAKSLNGMVINELSLENRKAARREILGQLFLKYHNSQIFSKINEYMVSKFQELHKSAKPRDPELVLQETFNKARQLFERTKPFIGNSFKRVYDPAQIEKNVHKYLWLKGICFLVLDITDEHRVALSYFYLPGNEDLKKEFLKDVVVYSYPEVPDIPENMVWQSEMIGVMDRLGYIIFNIAKFVQ